MKSSVAVRAALPAALLSLALVTGCSGSTTDSAAPAATSSPSAPTWKWHPAIANNIDPRKVVTQAEAEKLLGAKLSHTDVVNANRNDKFFPSNSRRVYYSDRKHNDLTVYDVSVKVTTKVIDVTLNHDGSRDGNGDIDVNAWGTSGTQTVTLTSRWLGLPNNSSSHIALLVDAPYNRKRKSYDNPTEYAVQHPRGVFVWGDQKLPNGKTRPVRFTIEAGQLVSRADLLALATKAAARMNLK